MDKVMFTMNNSTSFCLIGIFIRIIILLIDFLFVLSLRLVLLSIESFCCCWYEMLSYETGS